MDYIEIDLDDWIGVKVYNKYKQITMYHHKDAF